VNTLVLRTDASGDPTFSELLARVRETDLAAYAHQDVPFERVVEEVNPPRSLARHPLYQVALVLQNTATADAEGFVGLDTTVMPVGTGGAKFDLAAAFTETHGADGAPGGIQAFLEYATD